LKTRCREATVVGTRPSSICTLTRGHVYDRNRRMTKTPSAKWTKSLRARVELTMICSRRRRLLHPLKSSRAQPPIQVTMYPTGVFPTVSRARPAPLWPPQSPLAFQSSYLPPRICLDCSITSPSLRRRPVGRGKKQNWRLPKSSP